MRTFSNNLRLFWQGALLSYIALFHWMRPIQYMASKILMPLAQMFFFVYLGTFATSADNRAFYIVGNALQIAAVSGIYGMTMSVGGDRDSGTLGYILGTPANRLIVFWDAGFKFAFTGGDAMGGSTYTVPSSVAAGAVVDISVPMTAPNKTGTIRGNWRMSTATGTFFGDEVYVQITIGGASAPTNTGAAATAAATTAVPTTAVPAATNTP